MSKYDDLMFDTKPTTLSPKHEPTRLDEIKNISIKKKVVDDIVMPGVLDFLSDMAANIIESFADVALETADILIYKEPREHRCKKKSSHYHGAYDKKKKKTRTKSAFDYNDVSFPSKEQAERVKRKLIKLCDEYDYISVADFYREADEDFTSADEGWGWENIDNAYVTKRDGEYYLHLPKAKAL